MKSGKKNKSVNPGERVVAPKTTCSTRPPDNVPLIACPYRGCPSVAGRTNVCEVQRRRCRPTGRGENAIRSPATRRTGLRVTRCGTMRSPDESWRDDGRVWRSNRPSWRVVRAVSASFREIFFTPSRLASRGVTGGCHQPSLVWLPRANGTTRLYGNVRFSFFSFWW